MDNLTGSTPNEGRSDESRPNEENKEHSNADLTGKIFTGADAAVGSDPVAKIDMQVNRNAEAADPASTPNFNKNNYKRNTTNNSRGMNSDFKLLSWADPSDTISNPSQSSESQFDGSSSTS